MTRPSSDNERHRLLSGWCDGALTDAEIERLDELVRTDPEFRDFYLEYVDQHAVLAASVLPIEDVRLMVHCPGAACDEPSGRGDAVGARTESGFRNQRRAIPTRVPRVGMVVRCGGGRRRGRHHRAAMANWWTGTGGCHCSGDRRRPSEAGARGGFAVVVQLAAAEWGPGQRPAEGELLAAGRLVLRSGRITLGLLSGVTLTLEGPADLELMSIDRVHCRRGKLRTYVPRGAEGFVVTTPGSAVVDLGTEFGVNVADDGKTRVMVFKGEAEVAVINDAGAPVRSQQVKERRAYAINPQSGQIDEAAADSVDFVSPPVLAPKPLALDASYREAVLAAGPWAYWRFEKMDNGVVADEVAGDRPLCATGPVKLAGAGPGNRCLEFGSEADEQSVAMDGLWEPPSDPGYAVEFWALSGRIENAALVSLIAPGPPTEDYKHLFLLEFTARDRRSLLSPGLFRFLHRWPPGDSGGDNLFSTQHYVPYGWHHIVAQGSGGRLELYVDGVATLPVAPRSALATEPCRVLLGRPQTQATAFGPRAQPSFRRADRRAGTLQSPPHRA